jgi:uncharacterized lipoprotein YddW (UPF0748 family)
MIIFDPMKKKILYILLALICLTANVVKAAGNSKREFRGAWIQCVNGQFQGLGKDKMQSTLRQQLDELQNDGVNAIIFQVRAECDALYESPYEPWSRFLTGVQGKAPVPYWDPLAWMVEECHKRGMEIHAWINPYRAKTKGTVALANNHVAITHPERVFAYDSQFILNPGQPQNRDYICKIAADIVRRYDIDGFHIDDYFYPYPAAGQVIPDDKEYKAYSNGIANRGDWRRYNVDLFIKQLYETIHEVKPWVKFGVSPFGIYRNKKSAPEIGSETNGLQNYDDLYADVLKWVNNGWVDYCVPQIYWQIGHTAADYATLIKWWNRYCANRPLFIGEDVERTVKYADLQNPNNNQMPAKYALHSQMNNVNGTVLWYAKAVADNVGNYGHVLRDSYWRHPALQPAMPFIDNKAPNKPRKLKAIWMPDGYYLFWVAPKGKNWNDVASKYVVYRFEKGEKINLDDPSKIQAITANTLYKLPFVDGATNYVYVVTALDKMSNESKAKKKKIKL